MISGQSYRPTSGTGTVTFGDFDLTRLRPYQVAEAVSLGDAARRHVVSHASDRSNFHVGVTAGLLVAGIRAMVVESVVALEPHRGRSIPKGMSYPPGGLW